MMSLRRWLTANYDFTGIARAFYKSGATEVVAILLVAARREVEPARVPVAAEPMPRRQVRHHAATQGSLGKGTATQRGAASRDD